MSAYDTSLPPPYAFDATFVMAAVVVVLPWSM